MTPLSRDSEITAVRWLPARNGTGGDVPPFGLVKLTAQGTDGVYTAEQPTVDGEAVWVAGYGGIADGAVGVVTNDFPAFAYYDTGNTPAVGETWGAAENSWKLTKDKAGFRVCGTPDTTSEIVAVERDPGEPTFEAELTSGYSSGYSWKKIELSGTAFVDVSPSVTGSNNAFAVDDSESLASGHRVKMWYDRAAEKYKFQGCVPTTTKGDLVVHDGTDDVRLAVGTDGYVLTADAAEDAGVKWAPASGGSGYDRIQEEGSNLTNRATLNFIGGGITAADDAGNARTNVTLDDELNALASVTSAADKLPYFTGSATAAVTDLTSFIRTLLDDVDAPTARTTLGITTWYDRVQEEGSNLTQRATINFVGGGITAADDAGNTRTNVTLDTELNALASVTSAADKVPYFTGAGTADVTTLTSFIRTLLDDVDAPTARTTLGIVDLPTTTKGDLIVHDGSVNDRLPVGTNGYVLTADSGETLGVEWSAPRDVVISGGGAAWVKATKTYTDYAGFASISGDVEIYTLPAGGVVHGCFVKAVTGFTDGMGANCAGSVGWTGSTSIVAGALTLGTAWASGAYQSGGTSSWPLMRDGGATTSVRLYLSGSANLNTYTQGEVAVWLLVSTLP